MINQILKSLVEENRSQGRSNPVIRNVLKGALQMFVLDFIYNSPYGKNLIFTGGSALRICHGLNRLSEDVDFDLEKNEKTEKEQLAKDVMDYFTKKLQFSDITYSITGKDEKIYLKFPVLHSLGVAKISESDQLFVKIEISKNISGYYKTELIPVSAHNLNFVVKCYTIETLMSSKILAVVLRSFKKGKDDKITFKGRDYYDLLWFYQKGTRLYWERVKDVLKLSNDRELKTLLRDKIRRINSAYLKEDLQPLFEDSGFIDVYCRNYKEMIKKYVSG